MAVLSNSDFRRENETIFLQLASAAGLTFSSTPNITLIKLRQLSEALAQDLTARCGIDFDNQASQADLNLPLILYTPQ